MELEIASWQGYNVLSERFCG